MLDSVDWLPMTVLVVARQTPVRDVVNEANDLADENAAVFESGSASEHPEAQRSIVTRLAEMVNRGDRAVIVTQSLVVLYTINNLIAAHRCSPDDTSPMLPPVAARLNPYDVSAYLVGETVESIFDRETNSIDERVLGYVHDELVIQQNHIAMRIRR